MRRVLGLHMLAVALLYLLGFEGFVEDVQRVPVDLFLVDRVDGPDLALVEGLE